MSSHDADAMLVAPDCYMIGRRNGDSLLQCNTYLVELGGAGPNSVPWCVDPGSPIDYPEVHRRLLGHLGSLGRLQLFTLNHQDPDVAGNLTPLTDANESLRGIVSEDAWRLARPLGARPRHLEFPNRLQGESVHVAGGHTIRTLPTPFCHFRGAVAFYEPETRVLFTGDLFGGLNDPGRLQLWGEEEDWPGIAVFHQVYMPSREAVAYAIGQIRALDPPVEVIAPQHGFVLRGDFMHAVMERLEQLPVGLDRLPRELDEAFLECYQQVFQQLVDQTAGSIGRAATVERLKNGHSRDSQAAKWMRMTSSGAELISSGVHALPWLIDVLSEGEDRLFRDRLKLAALEDCQRLGAPLPMVMPSGAEQSGENWIG